MQNHYKILLNNIKRHQKRLKLSNEAFALSVGVSTRQVSRWMSGKNIPEKHYEKIAGSLKTDLDTLLNAGEQDDPDQLHPFDTDIEFSRFTCRVSQYSNNGFSLIKSRFGLSKSEIVEWAPALFYLIASQAMEDLQEWIDRYDQQVEDAPQGFAPNEDYQLDCKNKRSMLEARDIFGKLFGRTYDHARIPFVDAFIKLANAQRNELSPKYFGDVDEEGHFPKARILLDWHTCEILARGDMALASAIQDCSIEFPINESDQEFMRLKSDFEAFLERKRELYHKSRRLYEEVEASEKTDNSFLSNDHHSYRPTRGWQAKLWKELDDVYGEYQWEDCNSGAML